MKRVRGVDDITPPVSAATVTLRNSGGGVAGQPPAAAAAGGTGGATGTSVGSIEYHASSAIGVVSTQPNVRSAPTREMPSSIQLSQSQQQYPGAIVVPTAASSTAKGSSAVGNLSTTSCAAASSLSSGVTLHSSALGGAGNHSLGPQVPVPSSQAQSHTQTASAIRPRVPTPPSGSISSSSASSFQRLKVEDALSYLDQVKYKFSDQPQVYNDFLDIMKEFKSQSIDTPGVITRVSHLFKGHPELIVGFNTFLPPGYKIEVQANEQGYAFQVSVSMPSPTATQTATLSQHHCTVNVGSPPIATTPTPAKAQPVVQILHGSGSLQHTITNNINNTLTIHGPSSPPVLPYNNSHMTTAQAQAVSQALSQATEGVPSTGTTQANQPVEFNHAINYVNKIKNRFQGQPDKYKRFLEILHTYQKEQRTLKEAAMAGGAGGGSGSGAGGANAGARTLTEAEVYSQVAKLFENQEDLLVEFGQFLPDATSQHNALSAMFQSNRVGTANDHATIVKKPVGIKAAYNNSGAPIKEHRDSTSVPGLERESRDHRDRDRDRERPIMRGEMGGPVSQKFGHSAGQLKRSPSFSGSMATPNSHTPHGPPPPKKHKVTSARDVSIAEVGKHGSLNDYAFFDKVRKALRSQEVYENFLRCLVLFNQEIISKTELVQLVTPFLGRFPELLRWFKDFLGHMPESPTSSTTSCGANQSGNAGLSGLGIEALPNNVVRSHQDRPQGDLAMEIDYSTCKRLGASYCALPKSYVQPKCSGRTQLCREVLNDTWVSFPTWSEDSTFVTSRKTQFEEYIYRCEDERFELDGVIETNAATIRVLEGVHKKMSRMNQEELQKFKLDDCLGGYSPTIHQRALKRIYGDKSADIIEGLKKNPMVAVPVVLRRLKAKEEEWREAQKGFNKIWRDQNEKYYLKSLDHQGINFKQTDVKALRSKSLFNEIEVVYDEKHEQADENGENQISSGPHLILPYKDKSILDDAANLLIHHMKRQTTIHKDDKQRIKVLLKHFIPDMFFHPRQELSDDEQDDENDKEDTPQTSCGNGTQAPTASTSSTGNGPQSSNRNKVVPSPAPSSIAIKTDPDVKPPPHALSTDPEEAYALFMASNYWYLFFRLHQILCDRLTKMYDRAMVLAQEESQFKQQRAEATSVALRLKPKNDIEVEDYYPAFLEMVKNVLDGNMESTNYEDTLREMFGIHAYISFTLDKVVSYAVRQLQHLVSDTVCQQCMDLYQKEQRQPKESTGTGGLCSTAYLRVPAEVAYQRKAEKLMAEENCFKVYIYKKSQNMTIELLDTENEENAESNGRDRDRESVTNTEKWSSYVERFSSATGQSSPKGDVPTTSSENEPAANHPVSSDQAAKGGRGRKRKNTDINKKMAEPSSSSSSGNGWSKALPGRKRVYLPRNVEQYRRRAAPRTGAAFCGGPGADPDKTADAGGQQRSRHVAAEQPSEASAHVVASDELQCTFDLNSYRAVYVVNQEAVLYKRGCLSRAKQSHPAVTRRKAGKFEQWHRGWAARSVSELQSKACHSWLMGCHESLASLQRTRVLTDNDLARSPYRPYNRYTVEGLEPAQSLDDSATASTSSSAASQQQPQQQQQQQQLAAKD
ncbi:paired amphipathic helix protein Sin3a isoform X2 [Phymastichus coffea]|uniref:paired amphipathic helix protein Sin3a isoform X2 n=1 Tax=Phymastichus coffea TaxID=108790 RepID=UPI00273CB248|nr:paired amphipathic helix protein Sin3a isoform X2 [Phymastichus coffea]